MAYVVNRNINFTNVCVKACRFCAFSRGQRSEQAYFFDEEEIVRRAVEAARYGATEVCLQAGLPRSEPFIHKTGTQYRRACHAGVLRPQDRGADAVVVAVCAAGMDEHKDVDAIFQQVGRAVAQTALRAEQSAAR